MDHYVLLILGVEVKSTSKKSSCLDTCQIMPIAHTYQLLHEVGTSWSCHVISLGVYEYGSWEGGHVPIPYEPLVHKSPNSSVHIMWAIELFLKITLTGEW